MRKALGIDLGGTHIKWGVADERGQVTLEGVEPTESGRGPEVLLDKLGGIAQRVLAAEGPLAGVGIGTAGQVNRRSGLVAGATATLPGWAGMPLGDRIAALTGLSVVVDNDVNMMALGEAVSGAGSRWDSFLCVALGTGVGGCLVHNRRAYGGRDGYAGEFGHMMLRMGGRLCSCGGRGCWEAYASVTGLKALACEQWPEGPWDAPEQLLELARAGCEQAEAIVAAYCDSIAAGLCSLIHIFNPPAIVLGGAIVAGQGEYLLERVRTAVAAGTMPVFQRPEPVAIVGAQLGRQAGVIGAALAALQQSPAGS